MFLYFDSKIHHALITSICIFVRTRSTLIVYSWHVHVTVLYSFYTIHWPFSEGLMAVGRSLSQEGAFPITPYIWSTFHLVENYKMLCIFMNKQLVSKAFYFVRHVGEFNRNSKWMEQWEWIEDNLGVQNENLQPRSRQTNNLPSFT